MQPIHCASASDRNRSYALLHSLSMAQSLSNPAIIIAESILPVKGASTFNLLPTIALPQGFSETFPDRPESNFTEY